MKNTAYCYYRDINSSTIEEQRTAVRKYTADNNINIVDEYIDKAQIAANRDGYQKMLSDIDKNPDVTCILVYKLDRIHRNAKKMLDTIAVLKEKGIDITAIDIK